MEGQVIPPAARSPGQFGDHFEIVGWFELIISRFLGRRSAIGTGPEDGMDFPTGQVMVSLQPAVTSWQKSESYLYSK